MVMTCMARKTKALTVRKHVVIFVVIDVMCNHPRMHTARHGRDVHRHFLLPPHQPGPVIFFAFGYLFDALFTASNSLHVSMLTRSFRMSRCSILNVYRGIR